MRTLLLLEDALEDNPQMRSLVRLFEEDTGKLRSYASSLHEALLRVVSTQNEMAAAIQNLGFVLGSYRSQDLPLDQTEYDMPEVAGRLEQNVGELGSWHEVLGQQLTNCVLLPVEKLTKTLELASCLQDQFHAAESDMEAAFSRFGRLQRKDHARKLDEANNDLFFARRNFHDVSLKYYSHLNALQFLRYTHVVEPVLSLIYAFRSFFQMGSDGLKQPELSDFATRTQEQIQSIHGEYKAEMERAVQLKQTVEQLQKMQPEMYFGESPKVAEGILEAPTVDPRLSHKQGYLNMKTKSGFMTRWERHFFFTQGSHLMHQGKDELGGQVLMDLSGVSPGSGGSAASSRSSSPHGLVATPAENEDRRYCFLISVGPTDTNAKGRHFTVQALNAGEALEWMTVVNNLAGTPMDDKDLSPSAISKPLSIGAESPFPGPSTPLSTPATLPVEPRFQKGVDEGASASEDPVSEPADVPIQFDILGEEESPEEPAKKTETEWGRFPVRFLGSMEVLTDKGDRMIQETIRQIMTARATHNIFKTSEGHIIVDADNSGRLFLVDSETGVKKASFSLGDLAYWTVHPDNERLFAFIARARGWSGTGPRRRPRFNCFVFEAGVSGSEICSALTEGTKKAFQSLLARKTSQTPQDADDATMAIGDLELESAQET